MSVALALSAFVAGGAVAQTDVVYEYDELGRLKKTTYENQSKDVGYYYDAAGNREAVVVAAKGTLPVEAPTVSGVVVVPLNGFTVIPLK